MSEMDAATRARIEDFAWDSDEPGEDVVDSLRLILHHRPTDDEIEVPIDVWKKCVQEVQQS